MSSLLILIAGCLGALAGPLLVRPGYRLAVEPEQPWRADCPAGHPLGRRVAGWVGPGRCPACRAGGGVGYGGSAGRLAVVTAVCCAVVAAVAGRAPELAVWLLAVPSLVLLGSVDLAVQRLPDVLTLPLAGVLAGGLGIAALLPGAEGSWPRALAGGLALTAVYFVLFLINPRGMGFGDVKLAASIGLILGWYGWDLVFFGTFAGFLLAAGYGLCLVALRRADRRTAVPFGPFMALGALVALAVGGLAG
ncbi:A24 family peptidase [Streptomyces sp. DSM 44915]|uniref:A24 family peptidase n=1 Tax=Streptomyces chisholmiae TaxID=3075540 RepID=A0ABU2JK80_9ACTN|nr:A24 family peptidase [Streptomyces sp. DSM 44915]MDT0265394.1 A24 family peptidase [Streptomyces sp. DSM 44915]